MKATVIAIVGASGSGKTSLSLELEKSLHIPALVSYTTRPMRDGEKQGREHHFVSDKRLPSKDKMLAYTKFGGYHYWTMVSQIPLGTPCTYVIDEKGLIELMDKFDDKIRLITVLVKRNDLSQIDSQRTKRDKNRIKLDEKTYDLILENNGTLPEFFNKAITKINKIL